MNHHFDLLPGISQTPIIKFGEQLKEKSGESNTFLQPDSKLKIRLDMREVLSAFKSKGFYTTFNGNKIFKEDFKGLYIAGGTAPPNLGF